MCHRPKHKTSKTIKFIKEDKRKIFLTLRQDKIA